MIAASAPSSLPVAATPRIVVATPTKRLSSDQRGRPGAPPAWQRPRPGGGGGEPFLRFRINWGSRDGADPRRILAHVCRRGDLDSQMVGAIHVHPANATFEVASDVAAEFERRARRPDRRDPHLVIVRDHFRGS